MIFQTQTLLRDLEAQVQEFLSFAEELSALEDATLKQRPNARSWNLLECLEHLNLYGDFYLPAIQKAIRAAPPTSKKSFKSGWLGNYFVNSMVPKKGAKKMKTFRDKNPLGALLDRTVITRFQEQQYRWLQILREAGKVSLQSTKVPLSIAPWLKLRLGDVLRFIIAHQERHKAQLQRLKMVGK